MGKHVLLVRCGEACPLSEVWDSISSENQMSVEFFLN